MRRILLAVAMVVVSAGPAWAREWELSGGTAVHYLSSPGVDAAATSDSVSFGDLAASVEVTRDLPFLDLIAAEARWQSGSTSASDFGIYDASLSLDHLEVGARAVRDVYPHVRLYAHADVGGVRGAFSVISPGMRQGGLTDVDWALSAFAGTGVDLAIYQSAASDPHPDFALGVRLELGYQMTGAMAFRAIPPASGAGAPLDTRSAPLGTLDADGAVFRIGVFGRW